MSFSKKVSQFKRRSMDNLDRVYRAAIRDMISQAMVEQPSVKETGGSFEVGKIPVDTTQLVSSLYITINGNYRYNVPNTFRREVDRVKATDVVTWGFTAPHAAKMEFGDGQVQGRFFVTKAVNRWNTFVNRAARNING